MFMYSVDLLRAENGRRRLLCICVWCPWYAALLSPATWFRDQFQRTHGSVVTGCGMLPVEFADEAGTTQDGDCCSGVNYASAGTVVRVRDFSLPSLR
jgi:hypothetical protein